LGIVGCAGIGRSHLAGLGELASCDVAPSTSWLPAIATSRTLTTWLMRPNHLSADDRRDGYAGHIVVEINFMVRRRPDYNPLEAASQSYRVLAHAFDEARIARPSGTRSV
jgi:hypothetical protein